MGDFSDLVSPFLAGHSAGVAKLASGAAEACRLDEREVAVVRRAALVHDLGRVAVPVPIWQKQRPLTAGKWERVRLHPYYTERILSRSSFLAALAPVATAHHERLDGSGYHRGVRGGSLTSGARLLAAADAYQAMTEPRPHRAALAPERAVETIREEARAGRLDAEAVGAVLEAAGQKAPRIERRAGLTEREVEVVALLARGFQTKQVAMDWASRSRPPTATSRTPTERSACQRAPPSRCSRWSTGSRDGENSRLAATPVARSVSPLQASSGGSGGDDELRARLQDRVPSLGGTRGASTFRHEAPGASGARGGPTRATVRPCARHRLRQRGLGRPARAARLGGERRRHRGEGSAPRQQAPGSRCVWSMAM
jgi:HD domain